MNELERLKLDALKELAYGASHEINNPLANIAARAQTLLREEAHPERRRALQAIHQQAIRAHEMIADLMLFARPPALVLGEVDVVELVRRVVEDLSAESQAREIEFVIAIPRGPLVIQADGEQLSVAIKAVCVNAIEAIGQAGKVSIAVQCENSDGLIEIADTGPGIPPDIHEHIFDPFFSGREAGRGLGFGLSKCWRIVTQHGGEIQVESQVGQGATFRISLPRSTFHSERSSTT